MQRAEYRETVFEVGLELECTGLVEIVLGGAFGCMVAARAYAADCKCAYGVGSAYIELLGIGHLRGVAVGMGGSCGDSADKPVVACEAAVIHHLCGAFDKLREGGAEEFLFAVLAAEFIYAPEHIAGLLH